MASGDSINRTGRVSKINYKRGTYEVTYFDRGKEVTREINAQSNGEYMMPKIGDIVSVNHNSNGTAQATTTGTVWNKTNSPAEGYEGLWRKEYSNIQGKAYERYDANTGVYTQYTDERTGRNTNGEIYDEARGSITMQADQMLQLLSTESSAAMQAAEGVGITAGKNITLEAGEYYGLEVKADASVEIGGKTTAEYTDDIKIDVTKAKKVEITVKEADITLKAAKGLASITIAKDGTITIDSRTALLLKSPGLQLIYG